MDKLDNYQKIKLAILSAGYTNLEDFYEGKLKLTRGQFNYHVKKHPLDPEFVQKIEKALNIQTNVSKRQTNVLNEPEIEYRKEFKYDVKKVPESAFMKVPVLTIYAQAGYLNGLADDDGEANLESMLVPKEFEKGNYMVVEVQGDSMNDGTDRAIKEKDKLLVKELPMDLWQNKLHIHNNVWVIITSEGIAFKEIVKHDMAKGIITCHSWNKFYGDYDINLKKVLRLYYVKKLVERIVKA